MRLVGPIDHPNIDLQLIRPGFGVGLADVDARLTPLPEGWTIAAGGATSYGPATMRGRLITRPGEPLVVDVAALDAIGLTARGPLTQTGSAFTGNLDVGGSGVSGRLRLTPSGDIQRIEAALAARGGRLDIRGVPTSIANGTLDGSLLLHPDGPAIAAKIGVRGLERGRLQIDEGRADIEYRAGTGRAVLVARGEQGVPFTIDTAVTFAPELITIAGRGTVDREPVRLASPARLDATPAGWRLSPVTLALQEGQATVSGRFNGNSAIDARLDGVGLGLLGFVSPSLELSGRATGAINLVLPANGGLPQGRASLRIARFTRSGLAAVSLPVDIGLNAVVGADSAAVRAVAQRRGVIIGRMQAQLRPIPGTAADPWAERLLAAPLVAQLRWNGPAGALWPLTGIEAFEFRGPVALSADLGGRLGEPTVRGLIRAQALRFESTALGTVVEDLTLDGRFAGSRLELADFSGKAGEKGRVTGSGNIDLSAVRGFPLDLRLQLAQAQILRRDDLRATATGPLRITNGPKGGLIEGKLVIDRARFRIGRPAAEAVPELPVRERNAAPTRRERRPVAAAVWRLDIDAEANNDIEVDGMGLESEWEAQLKLGGRADQPSVTGRAELIRGAYEFSGRRFQLTRGLLQFEGGYPPNPAVDIAAEARVEGLTATLRIGGTAFQPEISFSSVPSLPEDEVLSRVLFGTSITNLSAPEALQLAGAVASLRGGSGANLDVFNVLRRGIGIDRLRILPGNTTTGRGASVAAGEYLGDRVYVEVATDAQGFTATQLEIGLTRSLSILSQIATQGGTSVNLRWSKDY
jgi:translocation and assembly module TamB